MGKMDPDKLQRLLDYHLNLDDPKQHLETQRHLADDPELQELDRVLQYPRLQRYYTSEARRRFVALIAALGELVELPDQVPRICRDPGDDWVIACAVVGKGDVIVSGDRDLLDLGQVGGIPILAARQFRERLQSAQTS